MVGNQDIPGYNSAMPESQLSYVILHHQLADGSRHWDLCLQQAQRLATWQLLDDPARLASAEIARIAAHRIADHRLAYLDYQGPVSGDRGHVTRIDRGLFRAVIQGSDRWRLHFQGALLIGNYDLVSGDDSGQHWTFRRGTDSQSTG